MSHATMAHCDTRFEPLLARFDADELECAESSVYGLWPDFTLAYLNPAWFRFAAENGGEPMISRDWGLGRNALLAIDEPLRTYIATAFEGCTEDGKPWSHRYECSSATRHREFHMRVYPLHVNRGYLVVNSLVAERAHDRAERVATSAVDERYIDEHGLISQCIHCRRARRTDGSGQWDWVPAWVEVPPDNASGGLCHPCFDFYFGGGSLPSP